jgi:hypothetical protein
VRWITILILIVSWCSSAVAGVINVEFKFTPFLGDPAKNSQVETVPGNAKVFINNVMLAEQEIRQQSVPVLFEERDIAPSVWVEAAGLGSRIRKGKNTIRIEFEPTKGNASYQARLAWASVMDQTTKQEEPGRYRETNESGQGATTKQAVGKVAMEREFTADFAADVPWHHYPPATSLTNEDKDRVRLLIADRVNFFKPNFSSIYRFLEGNKEFKVKEARRVKCLDKAYAVGIRVSAPARDQLDFVMTGNPEVVVQRRGGDLFTIENTDRIGRVGDDDMQMCAGLILAVTYPSRLVVVRNPSGVWEVAY